MALGGDLSVADAARVMRLAGGISFKRDDPRRVQVLEHDPGRVYSLEDVLANAASAPETTIAAVPMGVAAMVVDEREPVRLDAQPQHGEGRRHTTLRAWIAVLVNHFPDHTSFVRACAHGLNEKRLRPPKPEREVDELVKWVFKQHWGLRD